MCVPQISSLADHTNPEVRAAARRVQAMYCDTYGMAREETRRYRDRRAKAHEVALNKDAVTALP
eukprot:COSAG04_NODE_26536_length_293_cov_1.536082_1_plen_63_part_10